MVAYRKKNAYQEAEGRANDFDVARVLIWKSRSVPGNSILSAVSTYLCRTECRQREEVGSPLCEWYL